MRAHVRTAARMFAIASLALLLSGCIKAHQELVLHEDNTVSGTIVFALSRSLAELAGGDVDELLSQMDEGDSPVPEGVEYDSAPYDDDEYVGREYTFSNAPLETFDAASEEVSIVREGDTFVVSGTLDLSGEEFDPSQAPGGQEILDSFDVRIAVTFPGPVESANGEISGKTVSWEPSLGERLEMSAVGSAIESGGGSPSALTWIAIAAAVAIAVVVGVVVLGKRRAAEPVDMDAGFATSTDDGDAPVATTEELATPATPPATVPVVEEATPPAAGEQADPPSPADTADERPPD
jgi:hypothetical protein